MIMKKTICTVKLHKKPEVGDIIKIIDGLHKDKYSIVTSLPVIEDIMEVYQILVIDTDSDVELNDLCFCPNTYAKIHTGRINRGTFITHARNKDDVKLFNINPKWYKILGSYPQIKLPSGDSPSLTSDFVLEWTSNPVTEVEVEYNQVGRMKSGGVETFIQEYLHITPEFTIICSIPENIDKCNCLADVGLQKPKIEKQILIKPEEEIKRFAKDFLDNLKKSDFDICDVYYRLFSICDINFLQKQLEHIYNNLYLSEEYHDDWFYYFHKLLRQADFFDTKFINKDKETIDGHLDMLLWSLIHVDERNQLKMRLEHLFMEF